MESPDRFLVGLMQETQDIVTLSFGLPTKTLSVKLGTSALKSGMNLLLLPITCSWSMGNKELQPLHNPCTAYSLLPH